jgi:hypothetical protein
MLIGLMCLAIIIVFITFFVYVYAFRDHVRFK